MFRYRVFIIRRLGCTKWWLRDAGPLGPDAPGAGGVDVMLISLGTVLQLHAEDLIKPWLNKHYFLLSMKPFWK